VAARTKNWDRHVGDAEEVARLPGFRDLRDRILDAADPQVDDVVVDIGAGTGLLALALAGRVRSVWAIDISPPMLDYLEAKAASAEIGNVRCAVACATSLPLVDASVDLAVSNYCFHHLDDAGKVRAIREAARVLRPGGRLVFGDMMFRLGVGDTRDREVITAKMRTLASRGMPGMIRLARNGLRVATGRWERPVPAAWWTAQLRLAGFVGVGAEVLAHEGGVAWARTRNSERRPAHAAADVGALTGSHND
jgi:ubiquinone/menaquinone biosynthesis C-methylase UbiE